MMHAQSHDKAIKIELRIILGYVAKLSHPLAAQFIGGNILWKKR